MPRAILMMTDGMRPDGLKLASTPNMDRVMNRGSCTMTAQSVIPSITITCHTSMFHSLPSSIHGITGEGQSLISTSNGLIEQIRLAGKTSAFVYNWDHLRILSRPLMLTASFMANISGKYVDGRFVGDDFIAEHACREIPKNIYDFVFVYWGTVDECGHKFGWMSDEYLRQIEQVDAFIGHVLDVTPQDTTIMIHSDHGGHDHSHGTDHPDDMTIPWMVCGPNIRENYQVQSSVTLLDVAPTLARIMAIEPAKEWQGQCIDEIFTNNG